MINSGVTGTVDFQKVYRSTRYRSASITGTARVSILIFVFTVCCRGHDPGKCCFPGPVLPGQNNYLKEFVADGLHSQIIYSKFLPLYLIEGFWAYLGIKSHNSPSFWNRSSRKSCFV